MERVTIQEASHRLNLSQAEVRDYIRKGELRAVREPGPWGQRWMVELPEDGWVDGFKASLHNLARQMTPWWWPTEEMRGYV
ncbi:MAG: helix-turn-helix domain-containing protein, partial [Dehalococcoidia bacterium]